MDENIKILEAEYIKQPHATIPGTILDRNMNIACGEGISAIDKATKIRKITSKCCRICYWL
jgi:hypothetical protein